MHQCQEQPRRASAGVLPPRSTDVSAPTETRMWLPMKECGSALPSHCGTCDPLLPHLVIWHKSGVVVLPSVSFPLLPPPLVVARPPPPLWRGKLPSHPHYPNPAACLRPRSNPSNGMACATSRIWMALQGRVTKTSATCTTCRSSTWQRPRALGAQGLQRARASGSGGGCAGGLLLSHDPGAGP